ncbi:MAG: hypothetical protein R2824_32945 [Saprospiraceae bacterium]
MKTAATNAQSAEEKRNKEAFFQSLENDRELFRETFEVALTLVISDPDLTSEVADLIAADYRSLYLAIVKNQPQQAGDTNQMGCCKDFS